MLDVNLDNVEYGIGMRVAKLLGGLVPCFQGTAAEDEGRVEELARRSLYNCKPNPTVGSCHENDGHIAKYIDVTELRSSACRVSVAVVGYLRITA